MDKKTETKEERRSRLIFNAAMAFIVLVLLLGGLYSSRDFIFGLFKEKHTITFDDEYVRTTIENESKMYNSLSAGKTYHFLDPEIQMIDDMLDDNIAYMNEIMYIQQEDNEAQEYKLLILQYMDRTNVYLQSMRLYLIGETSTYPDGTVRNQLLDEILDVQSQFIYEPK